MAKHQQGEADPGVVRTGNLGRPLINTINSTMGAGARGLNSLEINGLAQWRRCDKDTEAFPGGINGFDLQCFFDAFNALFFEGRLAPVEIRWGGPVELMAGDGTISWGRTTGHSAFQGQVEVLILHRAMSDWQWSDAPQIYGVILHEMVHAYFALHTCIEAYERIDAAPSTWSRLIPKLRNIGHTGHGPEWIRMFLALEKVASHHLGLGEFDSCWKHSVETEVAAVKTLREKVAKLYRSALSRIDTEFDQGLSNLNALVGLKGVALHSFLDESDI